MKVAELIFLLKALDQPEQTVIVQDQWYVADISLVMQDKKFVILKTKQVD